MKLRLFRPWSIKKKITLFMLFLFLFLISIWSLAIMTSALMRREIAAMLGEQQFATVKILGGKLNEDLLEMAAGLEETARFIDPALMANPAALQDLLAKRVIVLERFNAGIFLTRVDGTAVASLPLETQRLGVNYIDREYIAKALKENKTVISHPMKGKLMQAPLIGMATPIHNSQGKVIAVVAGLINLGKPNFLDHIMNAAYGKTGGFVLFFPEERLIITATDKTRIMSVLPAPEPEPGSLIDQFNQGHVGFGVYVSAGGEEKMAATVAIPAADWRLTI